MSDKAGIIEVELQELLKDLGTESENKISDKEILLELRGLLDDWEEEHLEEELLEEETLLESDLPEEETLEVEERKLKLNTFLLLKLKPL